MLFFFSVYGKRKHTLFDEWRVCRALLIVNLITKVISLLLFLWFMFVEHCVEINTSMQHNYIHAAQTDTLIIHDASVVCTQIAHTQNAASVRA